MSQKGFSKILILVIGIILLATGFLLYKLNPDEKIPKGFGSYSKIGRASVVDGKLAFEAKTLVGEEIIVYDGNEYGNEYEKTYKPKEINGKLVFSAYGKKGTETVYYIIYGDEVISDTDSYYDVSYPVEVNGKIAYEAITGGTKAESNGKGIIVYNGKEYGKEYDWASEIVDIGGKLTYLVRKDRETFIVYGNKEIGKEYGRADKPTEINGKLAYIAGDHCYKLVYDGKVIAEVSGRFLCSYRGKDIYEINGKPATVATENDKRFIIYNGNEYGKEYNIAQEIYEEYEVSHGYSIFFIIAEVNNKLAYSYEHSFMVHNEGRFIDGFVVYEGKEYGKQYDSAAFPFEVNGKLAYIAKKDGKEFIIVDEKIVTPKFEDIVFAIEINGNLVYAAKKGNEYSVYK